MRIGIPKETKPLEGRVGLIAPACADLVAQGHEVLLETNAGLASGYPDQAYVNVGVKIVPDASTLYQHALFIVKVKEPQAAEWALLRADHLLFCYLHLAAEPALTQALCDIGLIAVAFETVETEVGDLPLLQPMSIIAGRLATQIGTHLLHRPQGGKGLLLGGLPGTERGKVVVLGAGAAGCGAAQLAAAMGSQVDVFDKRGDRLAALHDTAANINTHYAYQQAVEQQVAQADLLVGAVLLTGAKAPQVVSETMVKSMTPGSVIVDISVDQGGCIATTHPTNYLQPTYERHGITHFAVTNMPGAVPRTASQALSAAILPYVMRLTHDDWIDHQPLKRGLNIQAGHIMHPALLAAM